MLRDEIAKIMFDYSNARIDFVLQGKTCNTKDFVDAIMQLKITYPSVYTYPDNGATNTITGHITYATKTLAELEGEDV